MRDYKYYFGEVGPALAFMLSPAGPRSIAGDLPKRNKIETTTPTWCRILQPFAAIRMAGGLLSSPSQVPEKLPPGFRSFG